MKWKFKKHLLVGASLLIMTILAFNLASVSNSVTQQDQDVEKYIPPDAGLVPIDTFLNVTFTLQDTSTFSRDIKIRQIGELIILDGDMILGRSIDMFGIKSTIISGPSKRWKDGIIPYVIEEGNQKKGEILDAINHINSRTNVCFTPRIAQQDYVEFIMAGGCSSEVGRQGSRQVISVGSCTRMGNIVHEIGHTIGMFHEHARTDRDSFVTILESNIQKGEEENFEKYVDRGFSGTDLGKYDHGSIMHYGSRAYSKDRRRKKTILTIPRGITIGQRDGLSLKDISGINSIYTVNVCN